MVSTCMILAAGRGSRFQEITAHTPKPLIKVRNVPFIEYTLRNVCDMPNKVVNIGYLWEPLWTYLQAWLPLTISVESTLLETGGGIVRVLPLLGANPFLVCSADSFWQDIPHKKPLRSLLTQTFNVNTMTVLMALVRPQPHHHLQPNIKLHLNGEITLTPLGKGDYIYIGAEIIHPRLFQYAQSWPIIFSQFLLWKKASEHHTLYGVVYEGRWFHANTKEALQCLKM